MPRSKILMANLALRLNGASRREKERTQGTTSTCLVSLAQPLLYGRHSHPHYHIESPLSYLIAQTIPSFTEEEMKIRKLKSTIWDHKSCSLLRPHLLLRSYWQLMAFGRGQVSFFRGVAPGRSPMLQWVALHPEHRDSVDCTVGYKSWEEDMVGEAGRRCRGRAGCEQNTWYICMKFSNKICLIKSVF